ncbi:hypothetical protein WKI68_11460 [Streptomyces sp. MS1.HAVA.3]|uniref:Uncharacterized protein n=1 Tax=Streptomyces caledonius TaxID=3134107 RepID=A0ABU8U317_9ACTN
MADASARLNTGSHDRPVSTELSRYMAGNWAASPCPTRHASPATR